MASLRKQFYFNSRRLLYVALLFLVLIINPLTVYPAHTQKGGSAAPQVTHLVELQVGIENAAPIEIQLNQVFSDPDNDKLTFTASSAKPDTVAVVVTSDLGLLMLQPKQRGDAWITVSAEDGYNSPVSTRFRVLVYPSAFILKNGTYAFTEWDPSQPENVYPSHALFLQSDVNDPGLNAPLLYPYFIPHTEYTSGVGTAGFPYSTTTLTRLNGLEKEGIAFINTGRGRDLGGFLLALDTRNITPSVIDWLGGTLLCNDREYAIRLQYRVGFTGEFRDVLVAGRPVEYLRNAMPEHINNFSQIPLPEDAYNQEYVQLLWRYYYISGTSGTRAQLRLDDILVHANLGSMLMVEKQGSGNGLITSVPDGINCGTVCVAPFAAGAQVTLRVAPERNSALSGWAGDCVGTGSTCTFTPDQSSVVVASFVPAHMVYVPGVYHEADIVINEFMSSNSKTLADEDGDYSDWIELYNRTSNVVSLYGYGLSDNNDPFRWTFPNITLDPGQHLLVWASGKNRTVPDAPLHTNFSISADGERLSLTHPQLGTFDIVGPIAVPQDMSYGVQPDGGSMKYFFDHPTPGAANTSNGYTEILASPVFSQPGGFYTEEFNLTLTSDPDVKILYTLDGSIPEPDNLNGATYFYKNQYPQNPGDPFGLMLNNTYHSYLYNQPIHIVDRTSEPDKITHISTTIDKDPSYYFPAEPIFKGTVVRARAIKPGAFPSAVQTHTFFVTPEANNRYKFPVVSLSIPEDELFDYNIGIYVAGTVFDEWRVANPDAIANPCTPGNYTRSTEYPTYMELFETSSPQSVLRQNLGFRIQGTCSRSWPRKSLKFYARSEYGSSTVKYPIFPDRSYKNYKRFSLRNSGQDEGVTNVRDVVIQALMSHLRVNTQASRPAILFINGEYWGIFDLMERYDKYYLNQVYGVDPENIDYLTNNSSVEEGDAQHYTETLDYIRANGLNNPENYQYIQTRIDVDNFIDYQIANIYAANTDWPGNNMDFWRLRTSQYDPQSPYGHDGRWRWLLFDTDFGFGLEGNYTHNTLELATMAGGSEWPNPDWSTFLLRSLLENNSFRIDFINRFADLLNTAFLPERVTGLIADKKKILEPEMPEHIARWNRPASMDVWDNNINVMVEFANQRSVYQRRHIQQQFGIESGNITLNVSDPERGYIHINTIDITSDTPGVSATPYPWTGIYFKNIPVQITAIPRSGYKFTGWVEYSDQTSATISILPGDNLTLTAKFEPLTDLPDTVSSAR